MIQFVADDPQTAFLRARADRKLGELDEVRPWLQGYWYSLEEMRLLKQAAIDAESAGWSWWNAGGNYEPDLFEPAKETE